MHELSDAHDWLGSLLIDKPPLPKSNQSGSLRAPGHGWLWQNQDSNVKSADDWANVFLLRHLGAKFE